MMDHAAFKKLIWEEVRGTANEVELLFSTFCADREITSSQSRILFMLSLEPKLTVSTLSRRLGIAPGNLSPLCKKLEASGLVERNRSALDERVVEISLSEAGKIRAREIHEQIDKRCSPAIAQLTSEEMENIIGSIRRLNELLVSIKNGSAEEKTEEDIEA